MNDSCSFGCFRGYSDILLEEIALEGLEGITLEILQKRLEVNLEWHLKPIDNFVEEFILKNLVKLKEVQWFELKEPRECPLIFASSEEYIDAIEKNIVDVNVLSSTLYPHCLINEDNVLGSCSTYYTRHNVTKEIQKSNIAEIKLKYGNKLVVVASQKVRNNALFPSRLNPEFELADLGYCILERIGRSRRSGELSVSLTFLKNGPNPVFYFWNKLRQENFIKSQSITIIGKYTHCTLFHLPRFYNEFGNDFVASVRKVVEKIKSLPERRCLYSEIKDTYFPNKRNATSQDYFKRYLQTAYIPYSEFYPESDPSQWNTANGSEKLIKILKLAKEIISPNDDILSEDSEEEDKIEPSILDGNRLFNRPLLAQSYHVIDRTATEGISMIELGKELGVNRLFVRQLLKYLIKIDSVLSISSENARMRYYRYYSSKYRKEMKQKLQEQLGKSDRIFDTSSSETTAEISILDSSSALDEISEAANKIASASKGKSISLKKNKKRPAAKEEEEEENIKRNKLSSSTPVPKSIENDGQTNTNTSYTEHVVSMKESIFVMRRVNIVLEYVYKNQVVLTSTLKKIVLKEETSRGLFQGIPDRKSLRKVINILVKSDKVKILKKVVSDEIRNKSRNVEFLCVPNVDENHPVIQSTIQETKHNLSILYVKNGTKRINSSAAVTPFPYAEGKTAKYGFAPKFGRMKILHELLVYISYQYEGNENLNQEERKAYLRPLMDSDEELPRCYVKEIGWKMFIPPLLKYEEYDDGWISQTDLVDRLPLKLFFNLIRLPFDCEEVESYLHHPIKQYYLIHHLPPSLQNYVTIDKAYMYSLTLTLRNLCMIGLTQFGPKNPVRGNQNFIYVNKRTQLIDTRACPAAYLHINPNLNYPKYYYEFTNAKAIDAYWNDALRFCIATKLGRKKVIKTEKRSKRTPQRLISSYQERSLEEAVFCDTGDVPGDKLGAAGYDSSFYAHFVKQWLINRATEQPKSSSQTATAKTTKPTGIKSISKLKRFRNYTIRKPITKRNRKNSIHYDKVDVEALKKLRTMRANWTVEEDELLIMCYVASQFYVHPSFPAYKPCILFRKLLHKTSEKAADKTSEACKRRLANIMKNSIKRHNIGLFIKEIGEDLTLKNKFQHMIDQIQESEKDKCASVVKELLDKLTEEIFYYLYHSKKIPVLSKDTCDILLPDDVNTFKKTYTYKYAINNGNEKKTLPLNCEKDAVVLSFTNLILSTLLSQVDKTKSLNVNLLYQVFKQFDDTLSKTAYCYIRHHRLISVNKHCERQRSCYIPFGRGMYHLSITYHLILKNMFNSNVYSQIYSKYLEIISNEDGKKMEINNFDGGLNLLLISHLIFNKIHLNISIPDPLLIYNGDSLPLIAPEAIEKPSIIAKEEYTDKTLSIIRESFFKNASVSEDSNKMEVEDDDKDDEQALSDSESCVDEAEDEDDKSIDYSISKIALYVTRSKIKHSEIRSLNTYDLFLINTFPMTYSVNKSDNYQYIFSENHAHFLKNLEENIWFTKTKFTSDELMLKIRKFLREPRQRDCAVNVLEFLRSKGKCGATCEMLKKEFPDLQLLKRVTDTMYRKKLLIRSGAEHTHFVHLDFAEHWLIRSYKNINMFCDQNSEPSATIINRSSCDEFEQTNSDDLIWISIKPWVHFNGTINLPALHSFLIRVLGFITKHPSSSLQRIQERFVPALQPYFTRELIEILQQLRCVHLHVFTVSHKPSLFAKPQEFSLSEPASGFENEHEIFVEPDVHAIVRFSIFVANLKFKDLLETKYSTDVCSITDKSGEIEEPPIPE